MYKVMNILQMIKRRIKENMYTAGLAFSLMLVPLGYYLLMEGNTIMMQIGGIFSITSGIVLFLISWTKTIKSENKKKQSDDEKFDKLLTEIKELRKDFKRSIGKKK